jgi:hypothetical protein
MEKHCLLTNPMEDDRPKPSRTALALTRDALLDQEAPDPCADQTTFGVRDRFTEILITDAFLASDPRELLRGIDLHYSTEC